MLRSSFPPACTCREQLKDRQRFIVVSLGQRLLQIADMIAPESLGHYLSITSTF
jgi:hypothetical protein